MMKTLLIILVLAFSVFLVGCANQAEKPLCSSPYIEYQAGNCCLDANNNSICDKDEKNDTVKTEETKKPVCGDKICDITESCSSCEDDCGKCRIFLIKDSYSQDKENFRELGNNSFRAVRQNSPNQLTAIIPVVFYQPVENVLYNFSCISPNSTFYAESNKSKEFPDVLELNGELKGQEIILHSYIVNESASGFVLRDGKNKGTVIDETAEGTANIMINLFEIPKKDFEIICTVKVKSFTPAFEQEKTISIAVMS